MTTPDPSESIPSAGVERSPGPDALRLERLFREHHEAIFRAACRITGSAADAEDVLQTVFLRVARRSEGDLALETVGLAYLRRAAVRAALDVLRSRRRAGWAPLEEAEAPWAEAQASAAPERDAATRRLRRALRHALSRLSPRAAEIFTLRYFEDLPPREIADLVGASPGVVSVLLHRTRSRLARELAHLAGGIS